MLGFHVGFWDYATFLVLAILVAAGLVVIVFLLGLPGRIAIARKHPEADAVYDGLDRLPRCRAVASGPGLGLQADDRD